MFEMKAGKKTLIICFEQTLYPHQKSGLSLLFGLLSEKKQAKENSAIRGCMQDF